MATPCPSCKTPVPDDAAFCSTCGAPTPTRLSQEVGPEFEPRLKAALAERYRLVRELGRGGMAIVFLAEDLKHERQVAVKVLRPELAASLGADRFLREIRIAAKLQHQNVLPLYDSGEADGFLYYVMPFVEGESLRDKLNREKQLRLEEALQLTREICDGLGYAHEQGIVHRDIKPENVLLSRGHALIADFGIARAVSAAGGATLTATGTSIGTPLYMSPEQAAGDPSVDHRSDLYSVGCVLYEMLAGEPPFTGPNVQAIMAKHAVEARPSVRTVRDTASHALDATIRRAMARIPADRFARAADLAEALTGVGASDAPTPPAVRDRLKQSAIGRAMGALRHRLASGVQALRGVRVWPESPRRLAVLFVGVLGLLAVLGTVLRSSAAQAWRYWYPHAGANEEHGWQELLSLEGHLISWSDTAFLVVDCDVGSQVLYTPSGFQGPGPCECVRYDVLGNEVVGYFGFGPLHYRYDLVGSRFVFRDSLPFGVSAVWSRDGEAVFGSPDGMIHRRTMSGWDQQRVSRASITAIEGNALEHLFASSNGKVFKFDGRVWSEELTLPVFDRSSNIVLKGLADGSVLLLGRVDGTVRAFTTGDPTAGWQELAAALPSETEVVVGGLSSSDFYVEGMRESDQVLYHVVGEQVLELDSRVASGRYAPYQGGVVALRDDRSLWITRGREWTRLSRLPGPAIRAVAVGPFYTVPGRTAYLVLRDRVAQVNRVGNVTEPVPFSSPDFGDDDVIRLAIAEREMADSAGERVRRAAGYWLLSTAGHIYWAPCNVGQRVCPAERIPAPDERRVLDIGPTANGNLIAVGADGLLAEWTDGRWYVPAISQEISGDTLINILDEYGEPVAVMGQHSLLERLDDGRTWRLVLRSADIAELPSEPSARFLAAWRLSDGGYAVGMNGSGHFLVAMWFPQSDSIKMVLGGRFMAGLVYPLPDGRVVNVDRGGTRLTVGLPIETAVLADETSPRFDWRQAGAAFSEPLNAITDDGSYLYVAGENLLFRRIHMDSLPLAEEARSN